MGKKKQKDEEKREKPIFGSGAEPLLEPKDDGLVKCVCTVPCAWRGYHDEGDKVMVDRKLLESNPFFKSHFKPLEPLAFQVTAGTGVNENGGTDNENGGTDNENDRTKNATGGGTATGGENGQGELGLK